MPLLGLFHLHQRSRACLCAEIHARDIPQVAYATRSKDYALYRANERTDNTAPTAVQNMSVDHRRLDVAVAGQRRK